jgi:hypothetical protein
MNSMYWCPPDMAPTNAFVESEISRSVGRMPILEFFSFAPPLT